MESSRKPSKTNPNLNETVRSRIIATSIVKPIGRQAYRLAQSLIRVWQTGVGSTESREPTKSTKYGK